MLQCVAVCCSVLHAIMSDPRVLQCVGSVLECVEVCWNVLQFVAV